MNCSAGRSKNFRLSCRVVRDEICVLAAIGMCRRLTDQGTLVLHLFANAIRLHDVHPTCTTVRYCNTSLGAILETRKALRLSPPPSRP